MLKVTIHPLRVIGFYLRRVEVHESKNLPPSSSDLSWERFATKHVSSRLPKRWSFEARSVTMLGLKSQDAKRGTEPTAKKIGKGV